MNVERFVIVGTQKNPIGAEPDRWGAWVKYEDYQAAEARSTSNQCSCGTWLRKHEDGSEPRTPTCRPLSWQEVAEKSNEAALARRKEANEAEARADAGWSEALTYKLVSEEFEARAERFERAIHEARMELTRRAETAQRDADTAAGAFETAFFESAADAYKSALDLLWAEGGSPMLCQIGGFTWDPNVDGECPNHGLRDRHGNPRTSGAFCGKEGPEDTDGTPILGCCSIPVEAKLTTALEEA